MSKAVFLRELMPQDLKLEFDQLTCNQAVGIAEYLANSHARQMDASTRKSWRRELNRNRSKSEDASPIPTRRSPPRPISWLRRAVVELIAVHETAYLEHCHLYALDGD